MAFENLERDLYESISRFFINTNIKYILTLSYGFWGDLESTSVAIIAKNSKLTALS